MKTVTLRKVISRKAFTLIEMLIVTLIVVLLFYFVYRVYDQTERAVQHKTGRYEVYEQQAWLYQTFLDDWESSLVNRPTLPGQNNNKKNNNQSF